MAARSQGVYSGSHDPSITLLSELVSLPQKPSEILEASRQRDLMRLPKRQQLFAQELLRTLQIDLFDALDPCA